MPQQGGKFEEMAAEYGQNSTLEKQLFYVYQEKTLDIKPKKRHFSLDIKSSFPHYPQVFPQAKIA